VTVADEGGQDKASSKGARAKKSPARKTAAQKATGKKATTKKATTKKATPKKAATKKATPKKVRMPDAAQTPRPWLESYPPGVPETYDYPLVPLTRFLDDAAQDFPNTPAVEFLGFTLTYRELRDQVDRFATALHNLGVRKGDRVGIVLPNCPQHVVAVFATLRLGAIVAENNPLYTEGELEHQINDAGCSVLVVLDPVYQRIMQLKGKLPTVRHVIATGIQDALPFPKNLLFPLKGKKDGTFFKIPEGEGVLRFSELVARTAPGVAQVEVDPREDLAMLVYTGGTTGVSKGVMLSHFNLVANAFQARLWMPDVQAGRENILCVLPFFHSYGLTTCLTFGVLSAATLTLLPRFDRDMVLKTIDAQKPTLFPGVPTIYVALNTAPDVKKYDLTSVRACLSGAAPLPVEVAKTFEELTGAKLREGYGLTETSPITHANPIYGKAKKGSIGLPVSDTVCAIVDLDDPTKVLPRGEAGELAIWGPQVMRGYWNRPDETDEVIREGWLLTGDVAQIDDEGYFAIVDRKKDMIIAGGYNIYPRDIEEVLYEHPKVEKAVVAGVPDPYRGETVKAYIVLKEGQQASETDMDAWCREKLAAYKVPKEYEFRGELPETMVGKVLRRVLVEEELAKRQPTA
jgi:long-chain acyl-CoA synthetase